MQTREKGKQSEQVEERDQELENIAWNPLIAEYQDTNFELD